AAILVWEPTAHPLQEMLLEQRSPWGVALALVSAVGLAPVAEEHLCRVRLLGWREGRCGAGRPGAGPGPAAVVRPGGGAWAWAFVLPDAVPSAGPWEASKAPIGAGGPAEGDRVADRIALVFPAAFFAAVHAGQWPAPLPLFVLALGLGWLYRRTRGVVAPIAM